MDNSDYKIRESDTRFKLVISEKVESKIRWWCSKLPDNEWSGVLYYDYKGSFKNKDITFEAVDFLVLDIGTSEHTEFAEDERIISYACSQGLLNQQVGLLHSHNRMAAFYSGEDTQTLIKEGSARNHFLSLVVNNKGEYVAAITRKVKIKSGKIISTYKTFGNSDVTETRDNVVVDEFIEKINLDVVMPQNSEESVLIELAGNSAIPISKEHLYFDDKKPHRNDYPTLFKDESNIVDNGKITQIYNRLATASLGWVPCDKKLKFDRSLDKISNDNDETIYNFIISQIENLSVEELKALCDMLSELDGSIYVDMCLECINNNLEYYEC